MLDAGEQLFYEGGGGMNDVFAQLVKQYLPKLTSAAGKRRVEMAVRMSMAAV